MSPRCFAVVVFAWMVGLAGILLSAAQRAHAQASTFGGTAQHTSQYDSPAQRLNRVRWSTPIDLRNAGALAHYGAPLITHSNTVITAVLTGSNSFYVAAFEGETGTLKYSLTSDYILPTHSWVPVYQPVLANSPTGLRLYYAGAGGTVYYIEAPDGNTPDTPVQQCFYTDLDNYVTNIAGFTNTVFINTPITAGTNGVIYFGFRIQGTAPAPLSTNQSGFARIDPDGNATYVLAAVAADDPQIGRDSHNSAPALSNDGTTLYVVVKSFTTASYAYLLGLDSGTLTTKYRVQLKDPRNGNFATVSDNGTSSAMVAPDGDVYFGILANPNNGSRGFLLRFNAELSVEKTPSGFGWDYTPAIVPASMVPSYSGSSSYLLFSKYNNYAANADGDGVNRIALLDPNATQLDPHPTASGLVEMREVMTAIGCTPDSGHLSGTYPYAVREWCINSAAVNPSTHSIFVPSEDGRFYRWDVSANALTETITLGQGLFTPYVPTVIGPNGTIYTINNRALFSVGSFTNVAVGVYSSAPDLISVTVGQPVTFTAVVTNMDNSPLQPSGTVTFKGLTYEGIVATNMTLAEDVPLTNGMASVTTSNLTAGTPFLGNHFITATYSGDSNFPGGSVTLVQKVHSSETRTTLGTSLGPPGSNSVVLTATVAADPVNELTPTGFVSFWDGPDFLAQIPLNTNGIASMTNSFQVGSSGISARYVSDTVFAASSSALLGTPPDLIVFLNTNGIVQLKFTNVIGAPFSVISSTDIFSPLSNWVSLGAALEVSPGQFQFTAPDTTNAAQRFYRVRSP
jgi:hypothetical protein